jgi:transposase InsO family protein
MVTFIDEFSYYCVEYFMARRSDVFEYWVQYHELCRARDISIRVLRADNEFDTKAFGVFCTQRGIHREFTCGYTPQQNGRAERFNRTCGDMMRTLLLHCGLPNSLWPLAASVAVYTINRMPHSFLTPGVTPYELWREEKPDVSHMRVFVWLHMLSVDR